ncbi:MAG: division plane positioning ATPase MipZ [Alphaproteobacteria bacterium]|nr:division plane positioning ATPase MipZ [Alphaproteobacteria bacterium]
MTKKSHIIVVSNEKGGTGKSTISMHLAVLLLEEGFKVATVDVDARQGTLSKYIENRRRNNEKNNLNLRMPTHYGFSIDDVEQNNIENLHKLITELSEIYDAIIIDTPGSKNYLFDEAHKFADTLITPVSDSFLDLSVIADIDFETQKIRNPSHYATHIWEVKKHLAAQGKPYLNWIVVGNKISPFQSNNQKQVFGHLKQLEKLYGFRSLVGIKDRAIYKEMFLEGLTVLDMNNETLKMKMSMSHLAAKREIFKLAEFISPK